METVVGILVFLQHWHWFSLSLFLSLAFKPAALMGINSNLEMPKMQFHSNAKPSVFAYPPPLEEEKEKQAEKVETAVLSVTAKAKRKEKQKHDQEEKMDVDTPREDEGEEDKKEEEGDKEKTDDAAKKETGEQAAAEAKPKEPEPTFKLLDNPARVMKQQLQLIGIPKDSRYESLKSVTLGGIIIMKDKRPDQESDLVEAVKAGGFVKEDDEPEPEPPEPFEFIEANLGS